MADRLVCNRNTRRRITYKMCNNNKEVQLNLASRALHGTSFENVQIPSFSNVQQSSLPSLVLSYWRILI